jgi:multidrug resistance protein, MATE family
MIYPVMKFYALYHLTDGYKAVICGVMRALSQQGIAALVSLFSYYIIGFPLELLFGIYMELGVTGLWMG